MLTKVLLNPRYSVAWEPLIKLLTLTLRNPVRAIVDPNYNIEGIFGMAPRIRRRPT